MWTIPLRFILGKLKVSLYIERATGPLGTDTMDTFCWLEGGKETEWDAKVSDTSGLHFLVGIEAKQRKIDWACPILTANSRGSIRSTSCMGCSAAGHKVRLPASSVLHFLEAEKPKAELGPRQFLNFAETTTPPTMRQRNRASGRSENSKNV